MSTKRLPVQPFATPAMREMLPPLEPGDHLDQKTFHERYEAIRSPSIRTGSATTMNERG